MAGRLHILVLGICFLVIIAPTLYYHTPKCHMDPDVEYVKAKVLWVLNGSLYTDPVTGHPTFHPPVYHLVLAALVWLGIPINTLLVLIPICTTGLTMLFAYLIIRRTAGDEPGLFVALFIPFIIRHMGPSNLFLASSFHFSIPVYLAGLWYYLRSNGRATAMVTTAVLWGAAFLISPVYFFLIGFTFAYELLVARRIRRSVVLGGVFLVVISPFVVQALIVREAGMAVTSTFAFWRGVPGLSWFQELAIRLVSPIEEEPISLTAAAALVLIILGIIGAYRSRPAHPYLFIAAIAYLFTAYHFKFQYAVRVYFFITLFLVGYAAKFLLSQRRYRGAIYAVLAGLVVVSTADQVSHTIGYFESRRDGFEAYDVIADKLTPYLGRYTSDGDCVLATKNTYRHFIMPYFRLHSLAAYKSGEYFQLSSAVADEMLFDYLTVMITSDPSVLEAICDKYDITVAVIGGLDASVPVFEIIKSQWRNLHGDAFFAIYSRVPPGGPIHEGS